MPRVIHKSCSPAHYGMDGESNSREGGLTCHIKQGCEGQNLLKFRRDNNPKLLTHLLPERP